MNEIAEKISEELKDFPKISVFLLMRKTKQTYEYCNQLKNEICVIRNRQNRQLIREMDID